jgi:hypothetical protein
VEWEGKCFCCNFYLFLTVLLILCVRFLKRFKWARENFPEPFQRNILGGCIFVVAKDVGNLIYKYERIRQHRSRRVKNYDEVVKSRRRRSLN